MTKIYPKIEKSHFLYMLNDKVIFSKLKSDSSVSSMIYSLLYQKLELGI